MAKFNLTSKERKFLEMTVYKSSMFNCEKLDFAKSWKEQELWESGTWLSFGDAEDNDWEGSKKEWSGLCSSLKKKGLIKLADDDANGEPFVWLIVDEKEFNNIKEAMNE